MLTTTKPVLSQTNDPEYMIHFGSGWLFPWEIITDPGDSNTEHPRTTESQVAVNEPMTQIRNKYKDEGEDKSIGKEAEEEYMEDNEGRHSSEFTSTVDDDDNIPISSLGVLGRRKRSGRGGGKAKEIGTDTPIGNEAKETMEDNEGRPSIEFSNSDDDNDNIPISFLGVLGKRKRREGGRGKAKVIGTDKSVKVSGSMGDVNVAENDNADDDSGGDRDDDRTQEGQEEERKSIRCKSLRKRRKVSYIDLDDYTTYGNDNDAGYDANEGRYGLDDVSMDDDQKGSGIGHYKDKNSTEVSSEGNTRGRPRKEEKKSLSDYAEKTQRIIINRFGGDIVKYKENMREQSRKWSTKNRDKVLESKKAYYQRNKDKISVYRRRNRAKISETDKAYCQRNEDKVSEWQKAYYQRNKDKVSEWHKAYYQRNRTRISERGRTYHQRNKAKISEQKKAYRQWNKDKISERLKACRQRNKDKISEWKKVYYQKNKDRLDEYAKAYRKRKKEEKLGKPGDIGPLNDDRGS